MVSVSKSCPTGTAPCVVWGFALLFSALLAAPLLKASETTTLGVINSSPKKMTKRYGPLMQYLAKNGVSTDKIRTAKDLEAMVAMFDAKDIDVVIESSYGALLLMERLDVEPIAILQKGGLKEYNSVIFVKDDSPITSLDDLVGKVVAFEDKGSTSSFRLPVTILKEAGLSIVQSRKPVPGKVAYYFSKDDDNTVALVRRGRADAGGMGKHKLEKASGLRALARESAFVPRMVVLARSGMDHSRLRDVLFAMAADADAKTALAAAKAPIGFADFEGDATAVMDGPVRRALGL